jgi:hypothetical protein
MRTDQRPRTARSHIIAASGTVLDAPYPAFRASGATGASVPICACERRPRWVVRRARYGRESREYRCVALGPMRVLAACSLGGAGHLQPLVPFLDAARGRGHETLVIAPPGLAGMVGATGHPFRAGVNRPKRRWRRSGSSFRSCLPARPRCWATVSCLVGWQSARCCRRWRASSLAGSPTWFSATRVSTRRL